jgi:hypothetical protein
MTRAPQRRNSINEHFSSRLIAMLESPAYRTLSLSAHRVIARIEIELAHHGGNDNGKLPVTYQDLIEYGIDRDAIAPALREAEALGFIELTQRGRGGNAEYRMPNLYRLTFANERYSRQAPPTHEWRKIKTIEEAREIADTARANKSQAAVSRARRGRKQNTDRGNPERARSGKPGAKTRMPRSGKPRHLGLSGKPRLLSRFGEGGRPCPAAAAACCLPAVVAAKLPWSTPPITEITDPVEAAAIRAALGEA